MLLRGTVRTAIAFASLSILPGQVWPQQQMSKFDRDRAQGILQVIANDVKKHYYDPKFHGVDWNATVAEAKEQIDKTTSFNMAMSHIAAALLALNDSHTFFIPPEHAYHNEYGIQYQIIGERCFITRVRPKSDAESKGVKAGDEVLGLNGFSVTRDDLWKMQYAFLVLRPQAGLRFTLKDPSGAQHQVDVAAKFRQGKRLTDLTGGDAGNDIWDLVRDEETQEHLLRARYLESNNQLLVLKVPEFMFSQRDVETMIGKARKHDNLILDLRGNPGGSVDTLKYLVSGLFDKEVKIADRVERKDTKPEVAKPWHNAFTGKIVVLVDASSASAAEIFARIIQLEKRGVVVGDHTSGAVMEARQYEEKMGTDTVIFYGASITDSDLVMTDGKSLEHAGVMPDEIVLPTDQDIAAGRDPALARAAEILGVKLTPEEAGKAFPFEWPPE